MKSWIDSHQIKGSIKEKETPGFVACHELSVGQWYGPPPKKLLVENIEPQRAAAATKNPTQKHGEKRSRVVIDSMVSSGRLGL